jgi:hypothetical protein
MMNKTKKEIEQKARQWLEDYGQMTDIIQDYGDAYLAGFDAGQAQLLEQASSGFHSWYYVGKDCTPREFKNPSGNIFYKLEEAWQASQLSSAKLLAEKDKEIEATKKSLIEMTDSYENCFAKFLEKDKLLDEQFSLVSQIGMEKNTLKIQLEQSKSLLKRCVMC